MRITSIGGIILLGILSAILLIGDNVSLGGFITTNTLGIILAVATAAWVILGLLANSRREKEGGVRMRGEEV